MSAAAIWARPALIGAAVVLAASLGAVTALVGLARPRSQDPRPA